MRRSIEDIEKLKRADALLSKQRKQYTDLDIIDAAIQLSAVEIESGEMAVRIATDRFMRHKEEYDDETHEIQLRLRMERFKLDSLKRERERLLKGEA